MRRYETFIIIDPDLSQDERSPVVEKINELIAQQGGLAVLQDEWGSRKLAYEIKTKNRGYYIRFDYCGTGALVNEIERSCRIDDRVLKYMTVLLDKAVDIDAIKEEIDLASKKAELSESQPTPITSEESTSLLDESKADEPNFESEDETPKAESVTSEPNNEDEEQLNE